MRKLWLSVLALGLTQSVLATTIYESTDSQGNPSFSNQPQQGVTEKAINIDEVPAPAQQQTYEHERQQQLSQENQQLNTELQTQNSQLEQLKQRVDADQANLDEAQRNLEQAKTAQFSGQNDLDNDYVVDDIYIRQLEDEVAAAQQQLAIDQENYQNALQNLGN